MISVFEEMLLMKRSLILFVILIIPILGMAQTTTHQTSVFKPSKSGLQPRGILDSLLDPSKFSMSHSYSLAYGTYGKQAYNQGLYLNTMNYKFSDPLLMQVRIGFMHQPLGSMSMSNANNMNSKVFLQRAMLQYKPSDKMSITIDYQALPNSMYRPYSTRWD